MVRVVLCRNCIGSRFSAGSCPVELAQEGIVRVGSCFSSMTNFIRWNVLGWQMC